jgi:hypothetical protein
MNTFVNTLKYISVVSVVALPSIFAAAIPNTESVQLGECKGQDQLPTMNFGTGFTGSANGQEFRFKPMNEAKFPGQSTALNPAIIANFLCDKVQDTCKVDKAVVADQCRGKATAMMLAKFSPDKKGTAANAEAADAWNAFWGLKTNFAGQTGSGSPPAQTAAQVQDQSSTGADQKQGQSSTLCGSKRRR